MIPKNRGFGVIKTLIVIIVALALLKYVFNWSIVDFIRSPKTQDTLGYIWGIIKFVWSDYTVRPILFIYNWLSGFVSGAR